MNKIQYAKNMIRSYQYNKNQLGYLESELQRLDALLTHYKSPKLSENVGTFINPLEIFDKQDEIKTKISLFYMQIKAVEQFFDKIGVNDTQLIKRLYFEDKRYCDVCYDVYMSEITLKRYIDKLIKKYFDF